MGEPKRPAESRTLRFATGLIALAGVIGLIPELVTDPAIQPLVQELLPDGARRGFALVVAIIGFYVRHLRMTTTAPIEKRPAVVPDKIEGQE